MNNLEKSITFRKREFKGSRFRCLLLTNGKRTVTAQSLTSLISPLGLVTEEDRWAPNGFLEPDEAKLGETANFLRACLALRDRYKTLACKEMAMTPT